MTSNILKLMTLSFWCGWLSDSGLHMFIQDYLGLEGYIEFAREHWWHIHWMWGASMFTLALMYYFHKRREVVFYLTLDESDKVETDHDECG